jgi:hypothetical protein
MAGRIFISYSKAEPSRALADFLTAQGYTVWWDTNLTSGEVFREVIDRELAAADAVIVIWPAHSVASNWVVAEAGDAARRNKLITVRTGDLEPWRIPKPYNTYHTDIVDNRDAVLAAVRRVAGEPPKPEVKPSRILFEATQKEAFTLQHAQARSQAKLSANAKKDSASSNYGKYRDIFFSVIDAYSIIFSCLWLLIAPCLLLISSWRGASGTIVTISVYALGLAFAAWRLYFRSGRALPEVEMNIYIFGSLFCSALLILLGAPVIGIVAFIVVVIMSVLTIEGYI